jgi:hypothetical protein
LEPLQQEVVRIIGELTTVQGKIKHVVYEGEEKLTGLNVKGVEDIVATKTMIIKEVEVVKVASQNFIVVWKRSQ